MDIYPSLLRQSPNQLTEYITNHLHLFSHFQIDIADGKFVRNRTITLEHLAQHIVKNPPTIPVGTTFEFHLMVENFAQEIQHIETLAIYLPVSEVLIHYQPAIRWTQVHPEALHERLHEEFPFHFGLALNPEVDILTHYDTLQHFRTIQIMTIQPGAQGRPLIQGTLEKISELRAMKYTGRILLDGAMNDKTLQTVLQLPEWPDAICPGSYFADVDIEKTEKRLLKLQKTIYNATEYAETTA